MSKATHKEGPHHWIAMKLTSAALIPLSLWFVFNILGLAGADHAAAISWMQSSPNSAILLLFLGVTLYHSALGIEVVVGDYVHTPWTKMALLVFNKLIHLALAGLALVSVFLIAVKP